MIDRDRLLSRFLRYVQVNTTAIDNAGRCPSSAGQLELGAIVADELCQLGLADVKQNEKGIVTALVPANTQAPSPTVAFNAHFDTSPETTGNGVRPQVVRRYAGGDLTLRGDSSQIIRVAENPELNQLHGCTLITTDGTTLLGGDDKAGIAVIVELVQLLIENPEIPHGPVRVLFTCDEEIGHGVDHVDLKNLNSTVCYTLDGPGANQIDTETFSADLAVVTIRGINIHPSIAKDRMVNAVRIAGELVSQLPKDLAPESSEGRQGFLHPYQISGGVDEVVLRILLRDFDTTALRQQEELLQQSVRHAARSFPAAKISLDVQKQYRNMKAGLQREPRAVSIATAAHAKLGRTARKTSIRGGTDGSQLTERGLPTPNLSTGQHNPHSPLEWVCLEEMVQATEILIEIVRIWATEEE